MYAKHVDAFYEFRLITGVLLILLGITGSLGRLTEVPRNNFVLKGATAEFTCCSDIQEPLFWKVKSVASRFIEYIYDAGLVNGFRNNGRFNVTDGSRSGCYRLVISDTRAVDAGTYLCVDHQGLGQQIGWELVIVEFFYCQERNHKAEYMAENKFGLPEDVFSAACISKYVGNIPPKAICGWSSGTPIFDNHQHFTETNFTSTVIIQMPARKEFNGDQLSCYLKINGEVSNSQGTTAWESSHLIINYASFHQRGVAQCNVDELSLNCQPPCNYKTVRFSNGSSYCEITYPSKAHRKIFVSLQYNNLPQTTFISSTTNLPVESQAQLRDLLPFAMTALVSVLICCALAGATAAAIIIIKRKKRQRPNKDVDEETTLDPDVNKEKRKQPNKVVDQEITLDPDVNKEQRQRPKKAVNVEITLDPDVNMEGRQQSNQVVDKESTLNPDVNKDRYTISRPGFVISMGDGDTVSFNTKYGDQQGSVTTQPENAPLLKASSTTEHSLTPSIPFSESENVYVRGVAVLGEHLFFAYRGSSKVMMYSAKTLCYKTSWELKELTRPQDMTACSENNCLYISNIKLTSSDCDILKVSPRGSLINKWKTGINDSGRLSVTHDFNVLLAVHSNRRLVEYTTDGILVRKVQLADDLRPIYALKVSPGFYFISHGFGEDHEHGVSKVDANGQVLRRFGNTKGSTNRQLNNPVHLVINDRSIWVADSKNGRVIELTPTLEYQATLLSNEEDELGCPLRICLDQTNHRLLLSDFQNQNHFMRAFDFI